MSDHPRILFLSSDNSCRSQIAEAWGNHLKKDDFDFYSAGLEPKGLNLIAVRVMHEVGIDLHPHTSKHVDQLKHVSFDYVIALTDQAVTQSPLLLEKAKALKTSFDDPAKLASPAKTEEEAIECYRKIRDELRSYIESFPAPLNPE